MAPVKKKRRDRDRHFLEEWRKASGLTQEEAADQIGVSQSLLSRKERGDTPYDQDFLEAAAKAYNVSVVTLLTRSPNDFDDAWSVYDDLMRLDPDRRVFFIKMFKAAMAP